MKKIEMAPSLKVQLVSRLADVFLEKVIGHPEAFISDMSYISDFFMYPKERAIGRGKKKGTLKFKVKYRLGPFNSKDKKWLEKIIEIKPDPSKADIVKKTEKVFLVNIARVYNKPIYEILFYIYSKLPATKRKELNLP